MLTGKIRYRHALLHDRYTSKALVLQVEYLHSDGKLYWRDAQVEDLTVGVMVAA